jgi:hypothetical protein
MLVRRKYLDEAEVADDAEVSDAIALFLSDHAAADE